MIIFVTWTSEGTCKFIMDISVLSVLYVTRQSKRTDTMWTISFVYENSNKQEQFFGDCINEIGSGAVQNDKPGADQEKLFL